MIDRHIGVAPIRQVTHMHNKDSNSQGRSPNVVSDFPYHKKLLLKEKIHSLWEQILSRDVPILKRDAIEENHCLAQYSHFDVRNFFSVLATPLLSMMFKILNLIRRCD